MNVSRLTLRDLGSRAQSRYARGTARYLSRRPLAIRGETPLISFTFDDFPASALHTGGAILEHHGARGTYYASFGLMGTTAPTGEIFVADDLDALVAGGHEIGCHTYAHSDSWQTPPAEFGQSIARNAQVLERMLPGMSFRTFAYPISPPRPRSKRIATATFACCRGGGQRVNEGTADAGYLAAYFMEQARGDVRVLEAAVDRNSQVGGWLIFATHDVCEQPTPYGCTPGFFESVVRYAVQSGARVLPVVEAWASLVAASGGRDSRP